MHVTAAITLGANVFFAAAGTATKCTPAIENHEDYDCEWSGTAVFCGWGERPPDSTNTLPDGTIVLASTFYESKSAICDAKRTASPGKQCCDQYGRGCWTGHKRLICKKRIPDKPDPSLTSKTSEVAPTGTPHIDTKQYQKQVPIVGASVNPNEPVPKRLDINSLQGPQRDLYLLALQELQQVDHSDAKSYFQISGIHGYPYIAWNEKREPVNDQPGSYCPHGEHLLLPWHRAYTLLFEQALVDKAKEIAQRYPDTHKPLYVKEAETLRAPYWDWAANSSVPPITASPKARVNFHYKFNQESVEIDNPLWSYNFPGDVVNGKVPAYGPYEQDESSIRRCLAPKSYPDSADQLLQNRPYRQWVYDALTRAQTFTESRLGLEFAHNAIHWDAACEGQFLDSRWTAFDPLFTLHHANMDRLWAYWQALQPDEAIFSDAYQGNARFLTRPGTTITNLSPLEPFYKGDGQYHTTQSVRDISLLGYSYEGLESEKAPEQRKKDVAKIVNGRYGRNVLSGRRLRGRADSMTRFVATIDMDSTGIERPFNVRLFVGGNLTTSFAVVFDVNNITEYKGLGLDEAVRNGHMNDVLDRKLPIELDIEKSDGSKITWAKFPLLRVSVQGIEVTPPKTQEELPQYGQPTLYNVTTVDRNSERRFVL